MKWYNTHPSVGEQKKVQHNPELFKFAGFLAILLLGIFGSAGSLMFRRHRWRNYRPAFALFQAKDFVGKFQLHPAPYLKPRY